jgi:hypothetical protein
MVNTALYNSIVNVEKFCCSHTFAKCLLICCLFVQKCVEKALTRLLFLHQIVGRYDSVVNHSNVISAKKQKEWNLV